MGLRDENKPTVDLGAALQSQGLEFRGRADNGDITVLDSQTGEERTLDFAGIQQEAANQLNGKPENINFEFNRPDNALNVSPVTVPDRARLTTGNERGKINFLKKRFQDVRVTEENGIVVKDKDGVWKAVDPTGIDSFIQDPWEFAKDAVDLLDVAADVAVVGPAIALGSRAGPAGAIGGAAAGQGLVSTARTSLGRFLGTYEATPAEQAADVGMDMLFAAGGAGLAAGARPLVGALGRSLKKIARNAPDAVKNSVAGIAGFFNGTGADNTRTLIESSDEVFSTLKSGLKAGLKRGARKGVDATQEAQQVLGERILNQADQLANKAIQGSRVRYGKGIRDMARDPEAKNIVVNFTKVADDVFKSVEDSGLATIKRKAGKLVLEPQGTEALRGAFKEGVARQEVTKNIKQVENALRVIDRFRGLGTSRGKEAANALISLNQTMNNLGKNINPVDGANTLRIIAELNTVAKNSIGQGLGPRLQQQFGAINQNFGAFSKGVQTARKIKADRLDPEGFLKQALNRSQSISKTEALDQMVQSAGKTGQDLFKQIRITEAAKAYTPFAPKMGLLQTGSAIVPLTVGLSGVPGALGILAASSPRVSGTALGIATKVTSKTLGPVNDTLLRSANFLTRLPKANLDRVMSDPALFNGVVVQPLQNALGEDQETLQLLQDAGVIGNEQ